MRNWTEDQIKLILIRHGVTESNREHRYLGKTDEPLDEEGIRALHKARNAGYYPEVRYVFSSPMKRCIQTAGILYPGNDPVIIPEWEEMDFGFFEGKNYKELQGDVRYQEWIDSNGTLPFPGGESREAFLRRCDIGFRRMTEMLFHLTEKDPCGEKTVAAIVHGGTIMSLLSKYSGGNYFDYQVSNGEGYRCLLRIGHTGELSYAISHVGIFSGISS